MRVNVCTNAADMLRAHIIIEHMLVTALQSQIGQSGNISQIMHDVLVVPETKPLTDLLLSSGSVNVSGCGRGRISFEAGVVRSRMCFSS